MESDLEYVDSAFGGFCLIKTDVYNKVKWDETICEHHSFCENVKQFEVGQLHFEVLATSKNTKYIRFIYTL